MLGTSSSTISEKVAPVPKPQRNENGRRQEHLPLVRISPSSSSSSVVSGSNNDSVRTSVPSLFEAAVVPTRNDHDSQLAFTTEDLQITPKCSSAPSDGATGRVTPTTGYHHPIVPSPTPGSMKSYKKRFVRHGLMLASTSDLLDSINKRQGTSPPLTLGNDPPKNSGSGSNTSFNGGATGLQSQLRARPTVTTILRQQHVLEKAEKKERDKLESLMVSSPVILEVDNLSKEQEKKEIEEAKAAESKRLLQARLAYEKAIAASRKVLDEKQRIGESTRQKEKEWQSLLEKQRETERERRKAMTESLQRANYDSKRAIDEMLKSKQLKASKVKQETEQLQAEAKLKRQQDEVRRHDRIQQIQAAKLALKKTKETMGNPNQFYRSIAIPETQIKLRLQKEEEKRKLQETRQKIQAAKQMKSVKLIRAMKKIQSCESLSRRQQPMTQPVSSSTNKFTDRPSTFPAKTSFSYLKTDDDINNNNKRKSKDILSNAAPVSSKDEEIDEMLEQLKQLRVENHQKRVSEKIQRAQTAALSAGSRSSVKIIGANMNKSTDTLKNTNFYRHRSHYGIHV